MGAVDKESVDFGMPTFDKVFGCAFEKLDVSSDEHFVKEVWTPPENVNGVDFLGIKRGGIGTRPVVGANFYIDTSGRITDHIEIRLGQTNIF